MTQLQPMPPEEGVNRYLEHKGPELRESSMQNARHRLSVFLEWCEEAEVENLNDLTGRSLADFVAWRREDVAAITLQKQLSSVCEALRYWADLEAVEDGLAERLHAPKVPDGSEARDEHLEAGRAESLLRTLDEYQPGSRRHVIMALLWRTGMRRSALRSIDVDDLCPDEHAVQLRHRIDQGTKLKNGENGERMVYLGPRWYQIVERYVGHPDRHDVVDEHGREPLLTTRHGRMTGDTIFRAVNRATQPCEYGECPHDRDPDDCEARGTDGYPSRCPSSCGPHAVRRGSISHHLAGGIPPEVCSERMDVSLDVLYRHYDARTEEERMNVRKTVLEDSSIS